ncbi:MAG: Stage sporulation family protein [Aeromicrobium sp.]|nr:Stage sporulation family protein [Aeromicrobium sp.]
MRPPRTTSVEKAEEDWGLTSGLCATLATIGIDVATGVQLAGTYAIGAIVASMFTTTRRTAVVALVSIVAAVGAGAWHDSFGARDWTVRVIVCAVTALLAVWSAHNRGRREARLTRITAIAQTAQEAVLRPPPASIGPLDVAVRYVSAAQDAMVGGDLYEFVATPSATRLIIGDVRGKGLDAVRTAATALGAFRQSGYKEPDVAAVARALDDVIGRVVEDEEFTTALVAEFGEDDVTFANCGHHPPYLIRRSKGVLLDTGPTTPPLGLGANPGLTVHTVVPGDRLLFYTDGLVEARNRKDVFFPLEQHLAQLGTGDLDDALRVLVEALRKYLGGHIRDDVALVLVQIRESPTVAEATETGPPKAIRESQQRSRDRRAIPEG